MTNKGIDAIVPILPSNPVHSAMNPREVMYGDNKPRVSKRVRGFPFWLNNRRNHNHEKIYHPCFSIAKTMSTQVEKGKRWFKFATIPVAIWALVRAIFSLGHPSIGDRLVLTFFSFLGGVIIFGGIAFVLGWLTGKEDALKTDGVSDNASLSNVKHENTDIEKGGRYVSEPKGGDIVAIQDISHSGALLKAEVKSVDKSLSSDEAFYEKAFNELESEDRKVGLWAKVFAESQGNEALAKANYLKLRSGQLANEYKQALLEDEENKSTKPFTSPTLGANFVLIPAGSFIMGSPLNELGREKDETQHHVTISKPFYMQTTPITQEQWQKLMGSTPAYFTNWRTETGNNPVEQVSWDEVLMFIQALNNREGTNKYHLPTEAEWEYASRAGSTAAYCFGNDPSTLSKYAWYDENSVGKPHPVAQKNPNAWGLYDIHGNVWEWVHDWKGDYPAGNVTDPQGPSSGSMLK